MHSLVTIFQVGGDEALRVPTTPMSSAQITDRQTGRLIEEMKKIMRSAKGIGLAAPQIGQSLRLAVIHRDADAQLKKDLVMINPVLSQPAAKHVEMEEGCLSIPGVYGQVSRPATVHLAALDAQGEPYELNATGLLARVIQHEVDHLDGRLFIDRHPHLTAGAELLS